VEAAAVAESEAAAVGSADTAEGGAEESEPSASDRRVLGFASRLLLRSNAVAKTGQLGAPRLSRRRTEAEYNAHALQLGSTGKTVFELPATTAADEAPKPWTRSLSLQDQLLPSRLVLRFRGDRRHACCLPSRVVVSAAVAGVEVVLGVGEPSPRSLAAASGAGAGAGAGTGAGAGAGAGILPVANLSSADWGSPDALGSPTFSSPSPYSFTASAAGGSAGGSSGSGGSGSGGFV